MDSLEKKNTVSAKNQVSRSILFTGKAQGSPKILFLGNSMTKHSPAPQIGWFGDWGMAASAIEKDYVHLCEKELTGLFPDAAFCLVQGAEWERTYATCSPSDLYGAAGDFCPDVLFCLLSENVPMDASFDPDLFITKLRAFHEYLCGSNRHTKIIVASNFFNTEAKTKALKAYCDRYGASFVNISDLCADAENLAGDYAHAGIKIHPSDRGMEKIAERMMAAFHEIRPSLSHGTERCV